MSGDISTRLQRDSAHYLEWTTLSEPEAALMPNGPAILSRDDQIARAEHLWADSVDIHFHAFSSDSFAAMLDYFVTEINRDFAVAETRLGRGEIIAVLKRKN